MNRKIVFIHGLGGNAKTTWGMFPELIRKDPILGKNYEVYSHPYSTNLISLPFFNSSPRIQSLASDLKNSLENRYSDDNEITLVCHSLGGLVARLYILYQALDHVKKPTNNQEIKIRRLVLYATPNTGSEIANFGQKVSWWQQQIKQASKDSDFIDFLNKLWIHFQKSGDLTIPVTFVAGGKDNIVPADSSIPPWITNTPPTIASATHTDIVKPSNYSDDRYLTLRKILLREDLNINDPQKDLPTNSDGIDEGPPFFSKLLRSKITWSLLGLVMIILGGYFFFKSHNASPIPIPKPTPNYTGIQLTNIFSANETEVREWLKREKRMYSMSDKDLADELANELPPQPNNMSVKDYANLTEGILKKNPLIQDLRIRSAEKMAPFHILGVKANVEYPVPKSDWKNGLIAKVSEKSGLNGQIIRISYEPNKVVVVRGCLGLPSGEGKLIIQLNQSAFVDLIGTKELGRQEVVIRNLNPNDLPNDPVVKTSCDDLNKTVMDNL